MKTPNSILAIFLLFASTGLMADEKDSIKVSEFTFKYGEPWIRQQVTSSMRAGQLTYDHKDEKLKDVDVAEMFSLVLMWEGQQSL